LNKIDAKEGEFKIFLFYISSDNTYYVTQTEKSQKQADLERGFE